MKLCIWLCMIVGLFSCETRTEQSDLESIRENEITISLGIVGADTLVFYKGNNYDVCDLKCILFQDNEDFVKNKKSNSWSFFKAHLIIESSIQLKEVYGLIEILQSIGFRTIDYSLKDSESIKLRYRIPVNFDLIDLIELGCITELEEYDYRRNLRNRPPILTEFELPKRFILVIDSIGRYSVNDKTYTKLEYNKYVEYQFRNNKHKIVGLKMDDTLRFEFYFNTLKCLYNIVDEIRNEEALIIYNKDYAVLEKDEQKCIRKFIPKSIIDFQIKDKQNRGCGGMINWD